MFQTKRVLIYLSFVPILGPFMILAWLNYKSLRGECNRTRVSIFGILNGLALLLGLVVGILIVFLIHHLVVDISTLPEIPLLLVYFFSAVAFMNSFTLLFLVYKWDYLEIH